MKDTVPFVISILVAAALAPLVIPLTGGLLFFVLFEWCRPSVWGLPPLQSFIGVSINCMAVGYCFTWFLGIPLVLILRYVNTYHLRVLLLASTLPSFTLPFWQTDWYIAFLPVLLAGTLTAYTFWRVSNFCLTRIAHVIG